MPQYQTVDTCMSHCLSRSRTQVNRASWPYGWTMYSCTARDTACPHGHDALCGDRGDRGDRPPPLQRARHWHVARLVLVTRRAAPSLKHTRSQTAAYHTSPCSRARDPMPTSPSCTERHGRRRCGAPCCEHLLAMAGLRFAIASISYVCPALFSFAQDSTQAGLRMHRWQISHAAPSLRLSPCACSPRQRSQ